MSSKGRVAIIGVRGFPFVYSGYETFVSELAPRLVRQGYEIYVYCHSELFTEKPSNVDGVNLLYVPGVQSKILSQLSHSFLATCDAVFSDVDIVLYVNSANGPFGLITKFAGTTTAINVDGLEWLRPKWRGLGSKYFYWASKMTGHLFDAIITDSTEMRRIYEEEFNIKSTVIAYGANLRRSTNPHLIERWRLQKDEYYLIVGRLIPDNNADLIIREFISSSSRKKLVVVGDVPYDDAYAKRISGMIDQRLIFTGYVTDQNELAELYHGCFAYLHGHEFGGTNPALLKALGCGCAVLGLDTVFSKEVLVNGKFGILFSKERDNLKKTIEALELNDAKIVELRGIARNRIRDRYSWDAITDQYVRLFEQLTDENATL